MALVKFSSGANVKLLGKTIFSTSLGGGGGPTNVFWSGWSSEPTFDDEPDGTVTSDGVSNLLISDRSALTSFNSYYNNCGGSIDARNCSSLSTLNCYYNSLTTLDVSGCANLSNLDCNRNSLTTLDVSGCANLSVLSCSDNSLTTLDVSGLTNLYFLGCDNNSLNQAAVDQVLADMVANNYTGGNSKYIDLRNNAAPSASGLASKATLEGRGFTVFVDS